MAVAVDSEVLPTPPLPVKNRKRVGLVAKPGSVGVFMRTACHGGPLQSMRLATASGCGV
jgi:hypothetical protein